MLQINPLDNGLTRKAFSVVLLSGALMLSSNLLPDCAFGQNRTKPAARAMTLNPNLLNAIAGALMFTLSLFIVPFVGPHAGGLAALLAICGTLAIGNSLATPSLTSLSSKSVGRSEQGSVLGVTQSAASLARVVGPVLSAFLIYSATAPKHISDTSIRATFWAGAFIMLIAFLAALYFARSHSSEYTDTEIAPVGG